MVAVFLGAFIAMHSMLADFGSGGSAGNAGPLRSDRVSLQRLLPKALDDEGRVSTARSEPRSGIRASTRVQAVPSLRSDERRGGDAMSCERRVSSMARGSKPLTILPNSNGPLAEGASRRGGNSCV
jgi:hypothetical protein